MTTRLPEPPAPAGFPANVSLGAGSVVTGLRAFHRFRSRRSPGLLIGNGCTMDGVQFAIGEQAVVRIGDYCYFSSAIVMSEREIEIGHRVFMGWNVAIADSDFHPIAPAERLADAIACSPLAGGRPRPPVACRVVQIDDDVWIGPNAVVLKGVHIGTGAFIEPGSVITRDVPPRARMLGNPARMVGTV